MTRRRKPGARSVATSILSVLVAALITLVAAELIVRTLRPQRTMYPRWQYSAQYGWTLFPNRTMIHETPGRWRFEYTTNGLAYRGPAIPIADDYEKTNIVVLGDSYSFGTGVNDGEQFAAVLADNLTRTHDVINLSVGGWGITQHIRRYFEFGKLYDPGIVVLQYCGNDLGDNLRNPVTTVEDGRFVFRDSSSRMNWVKRYLSDSPLQRSQLYNLFRQPLAARAIERDIDEGKRTTEKAEANGIPGDQKLYADLLDLFARELQSEGTTLIVISVQGHLEQAPFVAAKVRELRDADLLVYCEVGDWVSDDERYHSKEGHVWGVEAHAIIGRELAGVVATLEEPPGQSARPGASRGSVVERGGTMSGVDRLPAPQGQAGRE